MIIIIIISIFKEDNVLSIIASLPYGPPVNTDFNYYQTFLDFFIFVSVAMLVVRYLLGEEMSSACLIILSTKQGSHWYHFKRLWYGAAGIRTHNLPIPKRMLYH